MQHQLLPGLRGQAVQRRVGVQVGGEGVAVGGAGDHCVQRLSVHYMIRQPLQQAGIERQHHAFAVHGFHGLAECRRNLQQVGHAQAIRRVIGAGGVKQRRVEEQQVALVQR
ncbi:hypothetical protein D3C80_1924770 [compost metagenome]